MCCHCVANSLICFIQILSLIHECQFPFGFFCSSIRQIKSVQYIKIVVGEFFNNVCRLLSNFSYLGFSLCRMSRVGNDHNKFIVFINKLNMKNFLAVSILVSAGLSVCKTLQFDINFDFLELASPLPFIQNPDRFNWAFKPGFVTITVFNVIYDLINYLSFVFVHLFVDLILIYKLKKVIREKEAKMREMKCSENEIERASKENDESKRRTILMVVLNSVFNFLTKIPSMVASLNDLRLLILKPFNSSNHFDYIIDGFNFFGASLSFRFFCSSENSCLTFQSMGNFLFLFSLASSLIFLKTFDKNFRASYEIVFAKKKDLKNPNGSKLKKDVVKV